VRQNVPRKGTKSTKNSLAPFAPVRGSSNPSTYVGLTLNKAQTRNAIIQTVQPREDIAPPTITLGRPASQVLKDQTLKKLESTTVTSTGAPLPVAVKSPLTHSFSVDLTPIRVHTDARAQLTVRTFNTRAFAYGHHIFLGPGESPADLRLMAHEVAHVVQQSRGAVLQHFTTGRGDALEQEAERASAAAVRGEKFNVQQRTSPRPQGLLGVDLGIPDPLDWLAGKANNIPGFRMLTIVLGVNPINMSSVDRSAANILRALVEVMPGGGLVTQALDNNGVFEKAGAFVEEQINALGLTGSAIKSAVTEFISSLSLPGDLLNPGAAWSRAERIFTAPIDQIKTTAINLVTGIIEIVKDAILRPIAKLAEGTEGYNLLKGVLGKDPITGDPVDRSAETLLGPLLKMIGLGDVWQKMQESKAIPRVAVVPDDTLAAHRLRQRDPDAVPISIQGAHARRHHPRSQSLREACGSVRRLPGQVCELGRRRDVQAARDRVRRSEPGRARLREEDRLGNEEHLPEPVAVCRKSRKGSQARLHKLRRKLPHALEEGTDRLAHRIAARRLHSEGTHAA